MGKSAKVIQFFYLLQNHWSNSGFKRIISLRWNRWVQSESGAHDYSARQWIVSNNVVFLWPRHLAVSKPVSNESSGCGTSTPLYILICVLLAAMLFDVIWFLETIFFTKLGSKLAQNWEVTSNLNYLLTFFVLFWFLCTEVNCLFKLGDVTFNLLDTHNVRF